MTSTTKTDQFIAVVETNKRVIYKVANSYCRRTDDREDLVQEIITQLWRSFDKYNREYKPSTWIYRISLNVAISFYRKDNRRKKITNPLHESILNLPDEKSEAETDANLNLLQQFILELKELDRALMLLYLEEKSHKEISEIMGITETNVATKIGRIKILLKKKFESIKF
ncbi:MAG: sigma-70 family RNA polymerase sigma factor [Prolixibacteraceae bacterium]|nr:sigma-70 family RNA polymerase sigma factor [Prolixibacteraceae bacterium]